MNTQDIQSEHRRLEILRALNEDSDYSLNDTLLQEILEMQGYGVSLNLIATDLAWLEEQALITTRHLPGCKIATLRGRGVEAAKGIIIVPGISRPRPE